MTMSPEQAIEILVSLVEDGTPLAPDFVGTPEQEEAIQFLLDAVLWNDQDALSKLEEALEEAIKEDGDGQ
jgi:hypothetical protein